MTDDKLKKGTTTSVTVLESEARSADFDALTPLEEKVLRMLHGQSESDDHMLKFALGADEETRLKLSLIEKNLMEAFQRAPAPELDLDESHIQAKAMIIDALRDD